MAEYIEREKAIDAIANVIATGFVEDRYITPQELQDLLEELARLPVADVAPVVHGRWTEIDASYWRWKQSGPFPVHLIKYRHDKCGKVVSKKEDYCPNCGAKMDCE